MPVEFEKVERYTDARGTLSPLKVPFESKVQFCITGANGLMRAGHAHREATQAIWVAQGTMDVVADGGINDLHVLKGLDSSSLAIIKPNTWVTCANFSPGCVYFVWCDAEYDEAEYIRDEEEFAKIVGKFPTLVEVHDGLLWVGDASWGL